MTNGDELLAAIERSKITMESNRQLLETKGLTLSLAFWARILENSGSIVLLLQHGFTNEAMAIHRISIEHLANFAGLLKSKCSLVELAEKSEADIAAQARILKGRDEKTSVLTEDNKAKLAEFIKEADAKRVDSPGLNTHNLLHACGLDFFHTDYRLLSIRAAHSTLLSATSPGTTCEAEKLVIDAITLLNFPSAIVTDLFQRDMSDTH